MAHAVTAGAESQPPWLVAREASRSRTTPRRRDSALTSLGYHDPEPWEADGGVRREAVLDLDQQPPRVVRYVGWRKCLSCSREFWSEDVSRVRMCSPCKLPDNHPRKPARR